MCIFPTPVTGILLSGLDVRCLLALMRRVDVRMCCSTGYIYILECNFVYNYGRLLLYFCWSSMRYFFTLASCPACMLSWLNAALPCPWESLGVWSVRVPHSKWIGLLKLFVCIPGLPCRRCLSWPLSEVCPCYDASAPKAVAVQVRGRFESSL